MLLQTARARPVGVPETKRVRRTEPEQPPQNPAVGPESTDNAADVTSALSCGSAPCSPGGEVAVEVLVLVLELLLTF